MSKIILCGDNGGTKTILQLVEHSNNKFSVLKEQRFASQNYPDFESILKDFIKEDAGNFPGIDACCFAVAGPVKQYTGYQISEITNLPWQIDTRQIAATLGIENVQLINDFSSVAYGINRLQKNDIVTLQQGEPIEQAPRVIIGAGTGLGICQMIWTGDQYTVIPSEGGHTDFAPTTQLQRELASYLSNHHDHVSNECILSGPGLIRIYEFLRDTGIAEESDSCRIKMMEGDSAAAITNAASHNDTLAKATLELFVTIYGSLAGNLALLNLAYGGVYIAGGIAPKIINHLKGGNFIKAFNNKGLMAKLAPGFPVYVVMNENVGLLGSAFHALHFRT